VIGTLEHGTGTISRSFLDKVASNYRANADAKIPFAEHDNMGKTFPPHRTNRSFNIQNIPQHLAPPGGETYHGFRSVSDVASQWRAISMRRGHEHIIAVFVECREDTQDGREAAGAPANAQMEPDIEEARLTSSAFLNEHVQRRADIADEGGRFNEAVRVEELHVVTVEGVRQG
jgi:hypothetical protein